MTAKQILESGTEMSRGTKTANGHVLDGELHEADPFPKRLTEAEKQSTPTLTSGERKQWEQALKTVEKGWKAFIEVGVALKAIRQSRLYREDYTSWEAFCCEVVGISKVEAYRQITDAEIVGELKMVPIGTICSEVPPLPLKRSHVRALGKLKHPEERRAVWQEIVGRHGDNITAVIVKEAVEVLLEKSTPPGKPTAKGAAPEPAKLAVTLKPVEPSQGTQAAGGADTEGVEDAPSTSAENAGAAGAKAGGGSDTEAVDEAEAEVSPEPASSTNTETEGVVFEFADGSVFPVSQWASGILAEEVVQRSLDEIAKFNTKDTERATRIQRHIAMHATLVNKDVTVGADKTIIGDLYTALHKVQQMVAALS